VTTPQRQPACSGGDEIVGGGSEGKHPVHARQTTVPGLIQLFNAEDARGRHIRVINGGELADAIKVALANHNGPTLIECVASIATTARPTSSRGAVSSPPRTSVRPSHNTAPVIACFTVAATTERLGTQWFFSRGEMKNVENDAGGCR